MPAPPVVCVRCNLHRVEAAESGARYCTRCAADLTAAADRGYYAGRFAGEPVRASHREQPCADESSAYGAGVLLWIYTAPRSTMLQAAGPKRARRAQR